MVHLPWTVAIAPTNDHADHIHINVRRKRFPRLHRTICTLLWTVNDVRKIRSGSPTYFSLPSGPCVDGHCSWRNQIRRRRRIIEVVRSSFFLPLSPTKSTGIIASRGLCRSSPSASRLNLDWPFVWIYTEPKMQAFTKMYRTYLSPFTQPFLIMVALSISSTIQLDTFVPILKTSPEAEVTARFNA